MTSNKEIFTTLTNEGNDEIVMLGDNREHQGEGSGSIEIPMDNGRKE